MNEPGMPTGKHRDLVIIPQLLTDNRQELNKAEKPVQSVNA